MEPVDLLCTRNARSWTPLVGRAQWKINQPPSLEITIRLGGSIYLVGPTQSETSLFAHHHITDTPAVR